MIKQILPGVWRVRLGRPERATPIRFREEKPLTAALRRLPPVADCPLVPDGWSVSTSAAGYRIEIPVGEEAFFGLGLQLKSLNQRGKKKVMRVNSDPLSDTGDSHAPVPFLVSAAGWGLLVDSLRYVSFYVASHECRGDAVAPAPATPAAGTATFAASSEELYQQRRNAGKTLVLFIPAAKGADVYLFAGPTPKLAVQRYNLFSGGGCLPAIWGLGVWYRVHGQFTQEQTLQLAQSFRDRHMPCDVLGLEPGWQTHTYSCTYAWEPKRFPEPQAMLETLRAAGFNLNLWEHVFTHPDSPLYAALQPHSADYQVWGGLVPDLTVPAAREAFADYHEREFIARGVSGFKLDECDNSDFISYPWSFPEHVQFPSGLDGEQMHSLLGILYQRCLYAAFRKLDRRTCCQVRSSHALAAPYPFVLYSDLYDHRDFVRGVANIGFSGLLWSPEVRDARSPEDLIRRIQSVVLSPQALINAWYIMNPPWLQVATEKNNRNEFMPDADAVESICRDLFRLRMRLLPFLYAEFARYRFEGLPPFRALALEWPDDTNTHKIDDAWMIGDALLVAPLFAGQTERTVYLPAGDWYDFHTRQKFAGGQTHTIAADLATIPIFVRGGTILPLAEPVECVTPETVFRITALTFGALCRPATLFEDDGTSFAYERGGSNTLTLTWSPDTGPRVSRKGRFPGRRYEVVAWEHVP